MKLTRSEMAASELIRLIAKCQTDKRYVGLGTDQNQNVKAYCTLSSPLCNYLGDTVKVKRDSAPEVIVSHKYCTRFKTK